jgi:hypothetical protein
MALFGKKQIKRQELEGKLKARAVSQTKKPVIIRRFTGSILTIK